MSRIDTLYLIHHSHTDIGYTHDQPILWDLQVRFLDEALRLADKYAEHETDGAFRWTVETTRVLSRWLDQASNEEIERFRALERAGRIEVTAMLANLTPLFDTDQLIESFQLVRRLRDDYGFDVRYAMNCDVNGHNWPLVDLLCDLGIEGFTMAINEHFGGSPFRRPNAFFWQGPSGRKVLAWNGWTYNTGVTLGIGRDAKEFEEVMWPRVLRRLEAVDYPLPVLMVQSYHPFGDNGPAYEAFTRFIDDWNEQGKSPRIRLATPSEWWSAVKEHVDLLPTHRGDWTDYWNFGSISSAREQRINRSSRVRLRTADSLAAPLLSLPASGLELTSRSAKTFERYREDAWDALHFWDEHTWGADCSITKPENDDTLAEWHHKAHYAYTARSLSLMLQRDALADLASRVERSSPDNVLIYNPLPWKRTVSGPILPSVLTPRGVPEDPTAGRHFQDRHKDYDTVPWVQGLKPRVKPDTTLPGYLLRPVDVPGYGYAVVSRDKVKNSWEEVEVSERETVETDRFRITFDRDEGGIVSWRDKELDREWVDQEAPFRFNQFVHEQVADENHPWTRDLLFDLPPRADAQLFDGKRGWNEGWRPLRRTARSVREHLVYRTPDGWRVVQRLEAPGCEGLLTQVVFVPEFGGYIECEAWWAMGTRTHPEATYLVYPFAVPGAVARFDVGGQAVLPGVDQLPGVCRDYFTVQNWVDFSGEDLGVTVAAPENPMVQLGDFHFGHNQAEFSLERPMLLGWVTNNYWETNFRAHQPGQVRARYRMAPYRGGFDEARAHRFGLEAANDLPVAQHLKERRASDRTMPSQGSLLRLPEPPVLTLHVKPDSGRREVVVRLLNASDRVQEAALGSAVFEILAAAECDLTEREQEKLSVREGEVRLSLPPRGIKTVRLRVGAGS